MIIRFTFRDNDFTNVIERFIGKNLFLNLRYGIRSLAETNIQEYIRIDDIIEDFFKTDKPTPELKTQFLNIVKDSFLKYLKDNQTEDFEYLARNLEIEEATKVQDKWENGEVVYYFTSIDSYLTF